MRRTNLGLTVLGRLIISSMLYSNLQTVGTQLLPYANQD